MIFVLLVSFSCYHNSLLSSFLCLQAEIPSLFLFPIHFLDKARNPYSKLRFLSPHTPLESNEVFNLFSIRQITMQTWLFFSLLAKIKIFYSNLFQILHNKFCRYVLQKFCKNSVKKEIFWTNKTPNDKMIKKKFFKIHKERSE